MQQSDFREAPDWAAGESRPCDLYRTNSCNSNSTANDVDPNMEMDRNYKSYRPEEKDCYLSEVCGHLPQGRKEGGELLEDWRGW